MLSVNIEDDALKLVAFQGKRVQAAIVEPLAEGMVQDGVVVNRQAVADIIAALLNAYGIKDREACACVTGRHSIYRVVSVPKLERSLMAEAARKEMERVTPVPLETLYTYWQDIRVSAADSSLCLLGIPHDSVDSVYETLKIAGLRIKILELKPISLARQVGEGDAIVIDVGEGGFDIVVLQGGIPGLMRSLPFTSSIMSDSEKVIQVKEEVARTVSFYNSSHQASRLGSQTCCFVSGNLREGLEAALEYSVQRPRHIWRIATQVDANLFAANLGLAARGDSALERSMKLQINSLPSALHAAAAAPAGSRLPLLVLIICAMIAAGTYLATEITMREAAILQQQVNAKLEVVAQAQQKLKLETDRVKNEIEVSRTAAEKLRAPLEQLARQRSDLNSDVGKAIAVLPATMYLTSVNADSSKLKLEGRAPNEKMVLDYARELRNSGRYNMVVVSSVSNDKYNEIEFKLNIALKR